MTVQCEKRDCSKMKIYPKIESIGRRHKHGRSQNFCRSCYVYEWFWLVKDGKEPLKASSDMRYQEAKKQIRHFLYHFKPCHSHIFTLHCKIAGVACKTFCSSKNVPHEKLNKQRLHYNQCVALWKQTFELSIKLLRKGLYGICAGSNP